MSFVFSWTNFSLASRPGSSISSPVIIMTLVCCFNEKNGLCTNSSSSSDPKYFLALFTAIVSSFSIAEKDLFITDCGLLNIFGDDIVVFALSLSRFWTSGVISRKDFDRGEKNDRMDFFGVAGFDLYVDI